jgi:hypothetical protein
MNTDNTQDGAEPSPASAGSHGDAVRAAALALYEVGRWVSVDVPREKADAMWATLRDALGLRPGHATARGVDGGGTKPTLTDEEQGALKKVLRRVREDYFAGRFADSVEVAAVIDGLLERTK